MESRHIKLNYEEALAAKKQLLFSELNLLQMVKSLRSYGLLRKQELTERGKLCSGLTSLKAKINLLKSTMPREGIHAKIGKSNKRAKNLKEKEKAELSEELEKIHSRLAKLG